MGLTVNTNVESMFAQRALRMNTADLQKSTEKLSTGYRINRAGDDAAGLSISDKMTMLIRGMDQAKRNIGDGIAMISTIDGALSTVQDNLQRVRELTVQAVNGTNSNDERDAIQREINERVQAIQDMGTLAQFNGVSLLQGSANITLQIGANDGNSLTMRTSSGTSTNTGFKIDWASSGTAAAAYGTLGERAAVSLSAFSVGSANVKTLSGTTTATINALANLDSMINNVSRMRSQVGAYENSLKSNMDYLDKYRESLEGARSRVRDVDVAEESGKFVKSQILQQTASAMLTQANSGPQLALSLLP